MSWAEVKKINGDLNTPLNEKMDDLAGDIAGAIGELGETMLQATDAFGETMSGAIGEQTESLENAVDGIADSVTGAGGTVSSSVQGLRSYISGLGDTVGNAIRSIDTLKPSLRVTVLDAGTVTVTDGVHTYTKEMEQPGVAGFILQSLGDFEVTLETEGQTFIQTVTVTELAVYRVTIGFPKLAVTAEEAGTITVSNGTDTYTETLEEAGTANFRLSSFGTYTVLLEEGQREGNKITVPREYTSTSTRSRTTSGNQNISTGVITNIGKCVQFNQSLVVRARYQNTPDSTDSIYDFELAVYHY